MTHHTLKLREEFWDAVVAGLKPFEIRENDRGFQRGDTVSFQLVDKLGLTKSTLNEPQIFEITYVLSGWGIKEGYVAFGIQKIESVAVSSSLGITTKDLQP